MTEQPPVPPGGYPPPPPPAGYQPPSPGAGWPPPPGQPVDDLPTEAYTSWIRRVGAYLIDYILLMIVAVISGVIAGLIDRVTSDATWTHITDVIFNLTPLAFLIWNEGYRQGTTGSSIGKSVLKFKVVSERDGEPIGFGLSIVRYFAHFLDAIILGIGYLLPLFTAKRQTIADMIMDTVCLPHEPPSAPRSRTPRPRIRMAVGVVVLAIAAILTVLAYLATTSHWVCPSGGSYPDCDHDYEKWVGPIGYGAYGFNRAELLRNPNRHHVIRLAVSRSASACLRLRGG